MKLELKDICGYLPYGLEAYYNRVVVKITGVVNNNSQLVKFGGVFVPVYDITPILRPMSDLTKPIMHKGKEIVPLVGLARSIRDTFGYKYRDWELNVKEYWHKDNCFSKKGEFIFLFDDDDKCFELLADDRNNSSISFSQLPLFDLLNELMFDYRGLIDKGIAINVNAIETDCYAN